MKPGHYWAKKIDSKEWVVVEVNQEHVSYLEHGEWYKDLIVNFVEYKEIPYTAKPFIE